MCFLNIKYFKKAKNRHLLLIRFLARGGEAFEITFTPHYAHALLNEEDNYSCIFTHISTAAFLRLLV